MPLTPSYQADAVDVSRGTAGSLRPDRVPGVSLTVGGGSAREWFNTAAFKTPAGLYGTASRYSIASPGTISNNISLSKTLQLGDTRSMEIRATASNVFNTVQYSNVDTNVVSPTFGQVDGTGQMRQFNFLARFRF
jgi:trimeric autotransporter adhesin